MNKKKFSFRAELTEQISDYFHRKCEQEQSPVEWRDNDVDPVQMRNEVMRQRLDNVDNQSDNSGDNLFLIVNV